MNLTVPEFGSAFAGTTTISGVLARPSQPELGEMFSTVLRDVSLEVQEGEDGTTTLKWSEGDAGEGVAERFSFALRDVAPGVVSSASHGWVLTIAAPKFVALYGPDGETWTFKAAKDAEAKSWLQQYGSFAMIGVLFVANTALRMWMGGSNGWAKKIATRDAAEASREVADKAKKTK
jgi:hypothetical protein